jgi:hypothetical protein
VLDSADVVRTIFFDESGYTGRNLQDPDQPYFVYAGVMVEPEAAARILDRWITTYDIPRGANGEVKTSSLLTSSNRRRHEAVTALLAEIAPMVSVAIFEKRFCLAAKFFDYVFDPILLPKIELFHGLRFAHFLANLILMYSRRDRALAQLLDEFVALVNRGDPRFASGLPDDLNLRNVTDGIKTLVVTHAGVVHDHVLKARELAFGAWLLDLTCTALLTLLMQIDADEPFRVICDESKPLAADISVFDRFVDNSDVSPDVMLNDLRLRPINLVEPISPRESHLEPGLQLADMVAGSVAYAVKNANEARSGPIAEALEGCRSIWVKTDYSYVDPRQHRAQVNLALLMLLAMRSAQGEDLFDRIEEFVATRT